MAVVGPTDGSLWGSHEPARVHGPAQPADPRYGFGEFYGLLSDRGFVIYPGKLSRAACFRSGTIGRIFEKDVQELLEAVRETLSEMGVTNPAP